MRHRMAGTCSLIAFAMCLAIGGFEANNPLATVLARALVAMLGSYVVGYCVGLAGERLIGERDAADAAKKSATVEGSTADGR